ELDKRGARLVRADHDDGFRLGALEREQRRLHRERIALVRGLGGDLHAALVHGLLEAGKPGAAERIALVEDRDPRDLQVLGQVLDPGLGPGVVAGANVDDVVTLRIAQKPAPVKAPMYGTLAAWATGCAALAVGVPTGPMSAKTLSSSMSFFVAKID